MHAQEDERTESEYLNVKVEHDDCISGLVFSELLQSRNIHTLNTYSFFKDSEAYATNCQENLKLLITAKSTQYRGNISLRFLNNSKIQRKFSIGTL